MSGKINRHRLHRKIGLVFLPLLLLSAITGFFRANHAWFWKKDYMKVKRNLYPSAVATPPVSLARCFAIADSITGKKGSLQAVLYKTDGGLDLYQITMKDHVPVVIDAVSGEVMSPVTAQRAVALARQYIQNDFPFRQCELLEGYVPRKQKAPRPVYRISYKDELNTEIYLDKYTGEIVEELDDNLRFGVWMVKLHDYDFWDNKRFHLSVVGAGTVLLGLSGLWLLVKRKKKRAVVANSL